MRYDWPGNVRELEATLHRAIVMSNESTVTKNEFYNLNSDSAPALVAVAEPGGSPGTFLNPMVGKMDITSEVYDEVMSRVDTADPAGAGVVGRTDSRGGASPRSRAQHAQVEDPSTPVTPGSGTPG